MTNPLISSFASLSSTPNSVSTAALRKRRHDEFVVDSDFGVDSRFANPDTRTVPTPPKSPFSAIDQFSAATTNGLFTSTNTNNGSAVGPNSFFLNQKGSSHQHKKKNVPSILESHLAQNTVREMMRASKQMCEQNKREKSKGKGLVPASSLTSVSSIASTSIVQNSEPFSSNNRPTTSFAKYSSFDFDETYSDDDSVDMILSRPLSLASKARLRTIDSFFPKIGVSKDVEKAAALDADCVLSDVENNDDDDHDDDRLDVDADGIQMMGESGGRRRSQLIDQFDTDGDIGMSLVDTSVPCQLRRNSTSFVADSNILSKPKSVVDMDLFFAKRVGGYSSDNGNQNQDFDYNQQLLSNSVTISSLSSIPPALQSSSLSDSSSLSPSLFSCADCSGSIPTSSSLSNSLASLQSLPQFQSQSQIPSQSQSHLQTHLQNHQCQTCRDLVCHRCLARNVQTEDGERLDVECIRCLRNRL